MDLVTYGAIKSRDYQAPELSASYRGTSISLENAREEITFFCKVYMADFDRETSQSAHPGEVKDILTKLENAAATLERLLNFNDSDENKLNANRAAEFELVLALMDKFPGRYGPSHTPIGNLLHCAIEIRAGAKEALNNIEGYATRGKPSREARKFFILRVAEIWKEQTGKEPTANYSDGSGKIESPFVRFLERLIDEMPKDVRVSGLSGLGDEARRVLRGRA